MCTPTDNEEAKMERVAEVIQSDAQLASCKTVAELCLRKPDVGSVLLGGNHLAREHGELTDSMMCIVSSCYVARCCFIARRSEELILLPHTATIAELKRKFYDLESFQVKSTLEIAVLSLHSASTEQEFIDEIVCKDPDGNVLEGTVTLPAASATACADVGCHATFFFDVKPLSMRETYVRDRINASSLAVNSFVQGLCGSGSKVDVVTVAVAPVAVTHSFKATSNLVSTNPWFVQTKHISKKEKKRAAAAACFEDVEKSELEEVALAPAPKAPGFQVAAFARIRDELTSRLAECTKAVPAKISAADLKEVMQVFSLLASKRDGKACKSELPGDVRDYAQELIERIQTGKFDALDPDFPTRIAKHLAELKTSIEELVLLQTDVTWINYETKTKHSADMSVYDITSKVEKGQEFVRLHQDTHLLLVERSSDEMKETIGECEELADRFDALHDIFERARTTRTDLSQKIIQHTDTCEQSLFRSNEANAKFQAIRQDENKNLLLLSDLEMEHKYLRDMICEQIKWYQNFVAVSVSDSTKKIDILDREMDRLNTLKQQEVVRRKDLEKCNTHLKQAKEAEDKLADAYDTKRATAQRDAQQRVNRSEVGVVQSQQFVERLGALHSEVHRELQDAADYYDVLIKQVGVDSYATCLNTGKFLAIQAAVTTKKQKQAQATCDAKQSVSLQANVDEDDEDDDTVECAKKAREDLQKAKQTLEKYGKKIEKTREDRQKLKQKAESFISFFRSVLLQNEFHDESPKSPSDGDEWGEVVVNNLPVLEDFRSVSSVAEWRKYHNDQTVSRPKTAASSQILLQLEGYERDFERRYQGETAGNLAKLTQSRARLALTQGAHNG